MEKGGKSPYGDWEEYYVVVTYDGTSYDYEMKQIQEYI